jgi:hypothetical protein
MTPATSTTYDLAVLPEGSTLHSVTATPAEASEWILLKIDVETQVRVTINGTESLAIADTKGKQAAGSIGLFVDIGTEASFSNFVLAPR